MTELINSLKSFASSTANSAFVISNQCGESRRDSRNLSLMTLGRVDSCTESGFNQWRDAMRMVARLPGGLPPEFRLRLWENLADRYLQDHAITWNKIVNKCCFGNSRDQEIADQIEKDLHRTGCTGFSGAAKQAVLKQVLISYAHWNPAVGYCQGFNMIGAMLLQMTNGNERLTLKILIYLIEGVLPEGYFSQGLQGLAVDMAVFREILRLRKPSLNAHLTQLQIRDNSPPLTDVFTMHWFLTLFIHCLPTTNVLRIWDLVLLEGSEVLLRAALVLWAAIEARVLCVTSTDEFYSVMGVATREMLEFGLMDPNSLVKCIVSVGPFPFPGLNDLRHKHRALISKDSPYKSFFLAKKELDALKKHYAAIRHRQRGTTIILKSLDAHRSKNPLISTTRNVGIEARNTLPIPVTTKRILGSPKPKIRRPGTITSRAKQITVTWDKAPKKPIKKFRKRRTASASSYTTSSSSSTELCDSSVDEGDEDDGASGKSSDNAWKDIKSPVATLEKQQSKTSLKDETQESTMNETPKIEVQIAREKSLEETEAELLALSNDIPTEDPTKCLDTNDSQHFLEEMSRLGKSDSFYENLSQRICELQFQNLLLLTTCNTSSSSSAGATNNKENLLDPLALRTSPLPSPISPIPNYNQAIGSFHSPSIFLSPSPRGSFSFSPRGSISSGVDGSCLSPSPRSPLTPSPEPANHLNISASRNSSSVSSLDLLIVEAGEGDVSSAGGDSGSGQEPDNIEVEDSIANVSDPVNKSPCQQETEESEEGKSSTTGQVADTDINMLIRENIAILQRLKLKPAYFYEETRPEEQDLEESDSSIDEDEPRHEKPKRLVTVRQNPKQQRRNHRTSLAKQNSNSSTETNISSQQGKAVKKQFNPFPTTRKARVKHRILQ